MPEIVALADRIVVMDDYRIKGDIPNDRNYGQMSERIMYLIHERRAA
jgi:ribose transport system ATP-binding protein